MSAMLPITAQACTAVPAAKAQGAKIMKALLAYLRRLEKKKGKQKGFTLIELMIVVAIIGVLAAVAIPAYSDYTAKAQVSEAFTLSSSAKQLVALYQAENGSLTKITTGAVVDDLNADLGNVVGKYVASVVISANGVITATMLGTAATDGTVVLTPDDTTNTGSMTWGCAGTLGAANYLPNSCS